MEAKKINISITTFIFIIIGTIIISTVLVYFCLPMFEKEEVIETIAVEPSPTIAPTPSPTPIPSGYLVLNGNRFNKEENTILIPSVEEYLPIRSDLTRNAEEIGSIPMGENFELLDHIEKRFLIKYQNTIGYVNGEFTFLSTDNWYMNNKIVTNEDEIYSYEDMNADIDELVNRYPRILSKEVIGQSYWGSDIPVVIIGDIDAENHVLIHGSIHGREHSTTYLLMEMIEYYTKMIQARIILTDEYNQAFADTAFHIVPLLNPDGVAISQFGLDGVPESEKESILEIYNNDPERLEYDTQEEYFERWKANGHGVDLNRNFAYGWENIEEGFPGSCNYKGDAPESEIETQAILDYTYSYPFDVTISYHCIASQIYYYSDQPDPDLTESYALASLFSASSYYPAIKSNSTACTRGGYKDFILTEYGIPSLTIEIGRTKSPLPFSQFPIVWEENRALLLDILEYIYR